MSFMADDNNEKQGDKTYIVICKLAYIVLMYTKSFGFRRRPQTTVRNEVHNPQNNSLPKHVRTEKRNGEKN